MKSVLFLVIGLMATHLSFSQIKSSDSKIKKLDFGSIKSTGREDVLTDEIQVTSYPDLSLEIISDEKSIFRNEFKTTQQYVLDGGEEIFIKLKITNNGRGKAEDVKLLSNYKSLSDNNLVNIENLDFTKIIRLKDINPGQSITEEITIKAKKNILPSKTTFSFEARERTNFGGSTERQIIIPTDYYKEPKIDFGYIITRTSKFENLDSLTDLTINPKDFFEIKFYAENNGDGPAKQLQISYKPEQRSDIQLFRGSQNYIEPIINIGDRRESNLIVYKSSSNVSKDGIPIMIEGRLNGNLISRERIILNVESDEVQGVVISEVDRVLEVDEEYLEESIQEDRWIPNSPTQRNRYAIIVGNEDYLNYDKGWSDTDGAKSDARLVQKYFKMVLGIPDENIVYELNVNTSDFPYLIEEGLKPKMNNNIQNKEIFVYYAGHGDLYKSFDERDEKDITKSYFIPVDARDKPRDPDRDWMSQDEFYSQLSEIERVANIYVFVDACFSGQNRDSDYASNKVKLDFESGSVRGGLRDGGLQKTYQNLHVFSAVSANQTAYKYNHFKSHNKFSLDNGLFTTFLLTSFQKNRETNKMNADSNNDNKLTANEINDFVSSKVSNFSGNNQRPKVTLGSSIGGNSVIFQINN